MNKENKKDFMEAFESFLQGKEGTFGKYEVSRDVVLINNMSITDEHDKILCFLSGFSVSTSSEEINSLFIELGLIPTETLDCGWIVYYQFQRPWKW